MTKVDFYILSNDSIEQRHLFACRLIDKAYKLGNHIYIHSDDNAQANAIDQLLWSWRSSSFIPHQLESVDENNAEIIQIGYGSGSDSAASHNGLMVNLSHNVPDFFSRFERVAEIVVQEPRVKESTRANYRFYRDRGYQLETHQL